MKHSDRYSFRARTMEQKLVKDGCAVRLTTPGDDNKTPVVILGRHLLQQSDLCSRVHGKACFSGLRELAPRLWLGSDDAVVEAFSFVRTQVMLASTVLLETEFGRLHCMPDAEYAMWLSDGHCEVAPLVIHLDDVLWRVLASEHASGLVKEKEDCARHQEIEGNAGASADIPKALRVYLRAHTGDDEQLLEQVQQATARGDKDLADHRDYLFKVFSIAGLPPTLSHDLSKTKLVNFCLGRCFHGADLEVLQEALPFDDAMALVRRLHLEVENHHPEHGSRSALSVLDMYMDRVSRGVQKTHGWGGTAAWHIPERFAPPEYRQDFIDLEQKYGHLQLSDPGHMTFPNLLPGARMDLKWEDN